MYANANALAGDNTPKVAQNSGVADLTPESQKAISDLIARGSNPSYQDQTFANNATAMSNGNDTISQMLAQMAQGGGANNAALYGIANGTDASTKALTGIAGGTDAASQYLKSVLGGQYLNPSSNPYLSGAVDAASSDATRNFQTAVMPQLASQFSLAGRYGSGAQSQGVSDATNNLAQQLSNTAANIYNTNYQNERGLQQGAAGTLGSLQTGAASALGGLKNNALGTISSNMNTGANLLSGRSIAGTQLLPQAQAMDYQNLQAQLQGAGMIQQQAQSTLEGNNAVYAANQAQPYNSLSWLSGILSGAAGLNSNTQSTSTSGAGMKNALGGALGGAATGAAVGSVVPGIGTGVGAAVGGLGGLLMGVL
jgi:hypothetical protein